MGKVINDKFTSWGLKKSTKDQRLYFLELGDNFVILSVVVEDIDLASKNRELSEGVKKKI